MAKNYNTPVKTQANNLTMFLPFIWSVFDRLCLEW